MSKHEMHEVATAGESYACLRAHIMQQAGVILARDAVREEQEATSALQSPDELRDLGESPYISTEKIFFVTKTAACMVCEALVTIRRRGEVSVNGDCPVPITSRCERLWMKEHPEDYEPAGSDDRGLPCQAELPCTASLIFNEGPEFVGGQCRIEATGDGWRQRGLEEFGIDPATIAERLVPRKDGDESW